ncbi:hypothetical protein [Spirillospora sp. NPDC047279]|uniref:hypothetical protein n=1 Tax=Spirillospora sp. NPDC047279 TaxID=3155478 RepID=UPI0033EA991A
MASVIGTIDFMHVGETFAKFQMKDETDGSAETFILFADTDAEIPDRVTQSLWSAILRDAILNGTRIQVGTPSANSAVVSLLTMHAAPAP